jgi:hypothetical protein
MHMTPQELQFGDAFPKNLVETMDSQFKQTKFKRLGVFFHLEQPPTNIVVAFPFLVSGL